MKELTFADDYCIFRCRSGSHAYGTAGPTSDTDIRGVFIAPPEYTLECMKSVEQVEIPGEDTVIYELAKFFQLAAEVNPNIIELLYIDESDILFIDPVFEKIRANRHLFLSRKAKFTFSGYAMAQMKRIRGHHRWLTNPQPEQPPRLLDFAKIILPDGKLVAADNLPNFLNCFLVKVNATVYRIYSHPKFSRNPLSADQQNIQYVDMEEDRLSDAENLQFYGTLIVQEETYKTQHRMWKDYWEWKKNRNPARAKMEEQHGVDLKHGMHLMRLLYMAREILTDGKVIVKRPDAQHLLEIRNGKFDYETLVTEAERIDHELDELYESSALPHSADKEAINQLFIQITTEYWRQKGLL